MKRKSLWLGLTLMGLVSLVAGCKPPEKAKDFRQEAFKIAENEVDPEVWGKAFPLHYEMWKKESEPTPAGLSKYKRGWDTDKIVYDKLSEFPFLAVLYNGWGFGIEYNEPRSHYYRMIDIQEIDPSRPKPGGVCLTCKTPYAADLEKQYGAKYYHTPIKEVVSWIPEKHRKLGGSCLDCHDPKTMNLHIRWAFTLGKALKDLGIDEKWLTHQQMRSLVCAQCHVTYVIPRDQDMKPTGIFFPWQGSKWGDISIENIIKVLKSNPAYGEWKQAVTGFKLAFIRHPEFELYSRNSVHWNAGVSCADCHMPYKRMGSYKVSEHRVMSPLKDNMRSCKQCHPQSADWLKQQVIAIQDRTISAYIRAGYQTAVAAKLFEKVHLAQTQGKTIDQTLYNKAKDLYLEAIYRVIFVGAENSVGFHNPTEAMRILTDALGFASKSEAILRTVLAKAGVEVPAKIDLEISKYINNRGEKKLNFRPEQEFKDPFGIQQLFEGML
ncbi:ammonia-forming cytochrome c nitrite reductase subunit c552 [Thermodesulfobacterium thermophilum]|uniref:ammonia-forming cytochrome c nitrite reductase subunit c552 n=1 Tax=Thermodesulfobacterium thermophilum TaxID=886 RepID=UPI0003B6B73E|nr:ammonia-forming cytochrome c nitrite reductase subunit c552 [Thermodesulfobacterium thermophilum]